MKPNLPKANLHKLRKGTPVLTYHIDSHRKEIMYVKYNVGKKRTLIQNTKRQWLVDTDDYLWNNFYDITDKPEYLL